MGLLLASDMKKRMWGLHYPWARTRGSRGLFTTPCVVCCSGHPTCLWASDFCPSARPGPQNICPMVSLSMIPDACTAILYLLTHRKEGRLCML